MKTICKYCLLVLSLFSFSCKKIYEPVKDVLPSVTHEGKGTFGFNLNGQLWLPKSKSVDFPPLSSSLQSQIFNISANRMNQHLSFGIYDVTGVGHYLLTENNNLAQFIDNTKVYNCTDGFMDITYCDFQKGIISGTFSMKAVSDAGDQISIEQGRFDATF